MGVPPALNSIPHSMECHPTAWQDILQGTHSSEVNPIPPHIQQAILNASKARRISPAASDELAQAMSSPFSFQEFEYCRHKLTVGKSLGPSGLTSTQIKHWGPDTARGLRSVLHHLASSSCAAIVARPPNDTASKGTCKIRPISLFEVIRKMWAGMVTTRIQRIWHAYGQSTWFSHPARDTHGDSASSEPP
jgi:hypothetical protein